MKQMPLFHNGKRRRAKARKLMRVIDALFDGASLDNPDMIRLMCPRCGHKTDWQELTYAEVGRGIACPNCN